VPQPEGCNSSSKLTSLLFKVSIVIIYFKIF
jgi:hypothetical protein